MMMEQRAVRIFFFLTWAVSAGTSLYHRSPLDVAIIMGMLAATLALLAWSVLSVH